MEFPRLPYRYRSFSVEIDSPEDPSMLISGAALGLLLGLVARTSSPRFFLLASIWNKLSTNNRYKPRN